MNDPHPKITMESPLTEDLGLLFARHTADMHADTPPESIHMMPRADLAASGIDFFVVRIDGRPVAMAALKALPVSSETREAEIKSMHVLTEDRGAGLSRLLLQHVINHARDAGIGRINLETGIQPTFISARALYQRFGFTECGPFFGYAPDTNSVFMTLELGPACKAEVD